MKEESVIFTSLSHGLSREERQEMLAKIQARSSDLEVPLYDTWAARATIESSSLEAGLSQSWNALSWVQRVLMHIRGILTSKSAQAAFQESELSRLMRYTASKYPYMFNARSQCLTERFYNILTALKEASRFFYDALDAGVNHNKSDFYLYLGSLEMAEVHSRLLFETDPEKTGDDGVPPTAGMLRQKMLTVMDKVLASMPEDERKNMYLDARSLACLEALASFTYDAFLLQFGKDSRTGKMVCHILKADHYLQELADILSSLVSPPSINLLEALFVFMLSEEDKLPEGTLAQSEEDPRLQALLQGTETALRVIREFNSNVPVLLLARCALRDPSFVPHTITGGEDWYTLYREGWKKKLDERMGEYLKNQAMSNSAQRLLVFFKGAPLDRMVNVQSGVNPQGFPLAGSEKLEFLLNFYRKIYSPDIFPVIAPLLNEAKWVIKDNDMQFTNACTELNNMEPDILQVDEAIGPHGETGVNYAKAMNDLGSLHMKREKMKIVAQDAGDKAAALIKTKKDSLEMLKENLTGIVSGGDDRYAGLSNNSLFTTKDRDFIQNIRKVCETLETALKFLE